jgi:hydroxysqualene synthase
VSVEHYENFPVASVLCPPRLRPAIVAIYRYARTADDIADEGTATAADRLSDLQAYRVDLQAVATGRQPGPRWRPVFEPLGTAIAAHGLPVALLGDLLSAFEQDVVKSTYADRRELLDYCRRSANPVGRLLLHLYGIDDAESLRRSDCICSALQLANFWQDWGLDAARGRFYVPLADLVRHPGTTEAVSACRDTAATRALLAELVAWTRATMAEGAPLACAVPGRAGLELRLVVQGGLAILDRIQRLDHATLATRPVLGWTDLPAMLWKAVSMRAPQPSLAGPSR